MQNILSERVVSQHGETLVVRVIQGVKALVDPCDEGTVVYVNSGRRALLVRFSFSGSSRPCGRDTLTKVFCSDAGLGFASVGFSIIRVLLRDLPEGQFVDILPVADPAYAYAALPRPVPALYGAVAVEPVYAAIAA